MRLVRTSNTIITGSAATTPLCTRSGILWLGEKTMTNENRYSESGITHSSGIGALSVVTKAVTPSIRLEGTNVNPIHRNRRQMVSLPESPPPTSEGSTLWGEPPPLTGSPPSGSSSSALSPSSRAAGAEEEEEEEEEERH